MKRLAATILCCLLAASGSLTAQQQSIAVFDFSTSNLSGPEMRSVVAFLSSELFKTGKYRVIDRDQRERLLGEVEFSLNDCGDLSCQLKAGRMIAAELIVVGDLTKVGNRYLMTAKIVETETAVIVSAVNRTYPSIDAIIDDLPAIAKALAGGSPAPGAPAPGAAAPAPAAAAPVASKEEPKASARRFSDKFRRLVPAPDTSSSVEGFGRTLSFDGNRLLIGATGAAFLFERAIDGSWRQIRRFSSPESGAEDGFGSAVALSGDYALVGAPDTNRGLLRKGVGAAYIYRRVETGSWQLSETLLAATPIRDTFDHFGDEVAICSKYAVVADAKEFHTAAVHVFTRTDATKWGGGTEIEPPTARRNSFYRVAISETELLVEHAGCLYVYKPVSGGWSLSAEMRAPRPVDGFGSHLALDKSQLAVGSATIVFIYAKSSAGSWQRESEIDLTPDLDGFAVDDLAISGDYVVVGLFARRVGQSGKVCIYARARGAASGSTWKRVAQIVPPTGGSSLGASVAVQGETIVFGDPTEDTSIADGGAVYSIAVSDLR